MIRVRPGRRAIAATLLLATGSLWAQATAPPDPKSFVREVAARPGETLRVDLDIGGAIEVEGWDRDLVRIEPQVSSRTSIELEAQRYPDGVSVSVQRLGDGSSYSGVTVKIRVPRRFDVRLDTRGGNLTVSDVEGDLSGETAGGEIRLEKIVGRIDLSTQGGNIRIDDSTVDGKVRTLGGNITLRQVRGTVESTTLGGNITFEDVDPPLGGAESSPIRVETHGGNIVVPSAPNGIDAETLGGNLTVGRVGRFAKLKSHSGNILVKEVTGWIQARTLAGNVTVRAIPSEGDRREIRLISQSGSVELTLPADIEMEAEIELRYTKNSRQNFSIDSDFPLEIQESPTWDYDQGTPVKRIRGSGKVGSGAVSVHIETVNGDVRLRKGS